jgi:hypothetical protein
MNHTVAYIMLKHFHPTLTNCQHAISLQLQPSTGAPAPLKMLLHLAQCQLVLAQMTAALSMLCAMLVAAAGEQPLIVQQAT